MAGLVCRCWWWGLLALVGVGLPVAATTLGDFSGDGRDDVLLRHADGRWFLYPMNGAKVVAGRGLTDQVADRAWRLTGFGDFDGDVNTDVLLRNFNGAWRLSALNGRREVARLSGDVAMTRIRDWRMAGVGDFDGDGRAEVLLRNGEGRWRHYTMNGRNVVGETSPNLTVNLRWQVQGIADLNGDGNDDVLLRNDLGDWYYYAMNGGQRRAGSGRVRGLPRDLDWRFSAVGHFDGGTRASLLMRHRDGRWRYHAMNGRVAASATRPRLTPATDWRLAATGDLNGDGRDEVLLRNLDGRWLHYAMNGHAVLSESTAPLAPGRGWWVARPLPPVPPPPLLRDRTDIRARSDAWRTEEFAHNPGSHEMNAHWAYARGITGAGESIGMVDTGIFALHEEFDGRLHDEAIYTVIDDGPDDPNVPTYTYYKAGERAPFDAYPAAPKPDDSDHCRNTRICKYRDYGHGTSMASVAVGNRNRRHGHGLAFDASLLFRPTRQVGMLIGATWYHGKLEGEQNETSRHDRVRNVGDFVPVVSNSWLTGGHRFHVDTSLGDYLLPFHTALGPRYSGYQLERDRRRRTVLVWSAGNRPITGGPLTDGAVLPSITERQMRAASGGTAGLADILLTAAERRGLSRRAAQTKAEQRIAAWRRQWLAVVAVADDEEISYDHDGNFWRFVDCAAKVPVKSARSAGECAIAYTMRSSARCGFASDWCVAVGSTYGAVGPLGNRPPDPTGDYWVQPYATSPAAATAGAALGLLMQAYRDADGRLTVGTDTTLERLKRTANAGIFDHGRALDREGRSVVEHEEEQVRALVEFAGASDEELTDLIRAAQADFLSLLDGFALTQEEDAGEPNFTASQLAEIEAAKASLSDAQWKRYHMLNRVIDYYTLYWRLIDPFPPQLQRIQDLLTPTTAGPTSIPHRDLLAQLIRQVEWIDTQLHRLRKNRNTVTDAEIGQLTLTSIVGHGLIDLKAATDPAQ